MSEITLGVALLDFVPVFLFLFAGIILSKVFSKNRYLIIPVVGMFILGFLKALCKLLGVYGISNGVLEWMSDNYLYLQLPFFVCIASILLLQASRKIPMKISDADPKTIYAVMGVFAIIGFLMVAVPHGAFVTALIQLASTLTMYCVIIMICRVDSVRYGALAALVSLIFALAMVTLSIVGDGSAKMHLCAESVNTISQVLMLVAAYRMYSSGLEY